MVQEVVAVEPDLELLRFLDLEVLEEAHVPVEERRAVNRRENSGPILADLVRQREAVRIDVLILAEAGGRIAGQDRTKRDVVGAQQRDIADVVVRAWDFGAI